MGHNNTTSKCWHIATSTIGAGSGTRVGWHTPVSVGPMFSCRHQYDALVGPNGLISSRASSAAGSSHGSSRKRKAPGVESGPPELQDAVQYLSVVDAGQTGLVDCPWCSQRVRSAGCASSTHAEHACHQLLPVELAEQHACTAICAHACSCSEPRSRHSSLILPRQITLQIQGGDLVWHVV